MGCGRISCQQNSTYGNGTVINMGNETDGFKVAITADLYYNDIRPTQFKEQADPSYIDRIQGHFSIFHGCFVESCPLLSSVYIGPSAHLLSSSIQRSTVLSSEQVPTLVREGVIADSILQWGVCFETHSNCCKSLLCEHAETSCNAKIVHSIIAPNTGVSSGECNSSLVGPFIGFHHNSVLISALWYEGKGNIGYGANIGSNHTGRLPDQECIPGEGVFFGLGCTIKYPCNLHNAPYSIIASGVTMLPQRVDMPFSLINKPTSWHAVFPGWVLYGNYYMIIRNEAKFRNRNKSKRNQFDMAVIRPEIVSMIWNARCWLAMKKETGDQYLDLTTFEVGDHITKHAIALKEELWGETFENSRIFLEKDIPGIGKSLVTEENRRKGIEIYTFAIKLFIIRTLYQFLVSTFSLESSEINPSDSLFSLKQWPGFQRLMHLEYKRLHLSDVLTEFSEMEGKLLKMAEDSKAKDFQRGIYINKDYELTHSYEKDMKIIRERKQLVDNEISYLSNLTNHILSYYGDFEL